MQISRNNYEGYFLLYIDGELKQVDRNAVEQFVKIHPDLEEELALLKESMLTIDELVQMPGKENLLKQVEWQEEDITATRQDLLLYLDNELPANKKVEFEKQLAKDSILNRELRSLEQTKLVAEQVEMPAKERLYRHEADRKPIPIRWTRWVAAAAAIFGIGWFSLSVINKQADTITPEVADIKTTERTDVIAPKKDVAKSTDTQSASTTTELVQYAGGEPTIKKNATPVNTIAATQTSTQPKTISKPDERDRLENMSNQIAMELPPTGVESGSQGDPHKIGTPPVDVQTVAHNPAAENSKTTTNKETSAYQYASYNDNVEGESEYVNIAGAHISKQKLRGVFRNVTRTVTRTFDKSSVTEAPVSSL